MASTWFKPQGETWQDKPRGKVCSDALHEEEQPTSHRMPAGDTVSGSRNSKQQDLGKYARFILSVLSVQIEDNGFVTSASV